MKCLTVSQLHREFIRNGSDVLQTFTFYSSDEQLQHVASAVYDNVPAEQNNNINMKTLVNNVVVIFVVVAAAAAAAVVVVVVVVVVVPRGGRRGKTPLHQHDLLVGR